tara:strand:+ start:783 stop:1553 length:771 start_codon:yes stop_codon:yes gene_type:complete
VSKSLTLDHFGFLELSGKDAKKFLQGYTTCNLENLTPETAQIGAICDIQGKVITSFLLVDTEEKLLLRMSKDLLDKTLSFLSKYIVFSKAEIKDISNELFCYGNDSAQNKHMSVQAIDNGLEIHLGNRKELWLNKKESKKEMDIKDWTDLEIELLHSWISSENSQLFLPQSLNYHEIDALDFEKGCYLGQEIIARMHFRGKLKKKLHLINNPIVELTDGVLVSQGRKKTLAILRNTTDQPIEVVSKENTRVLAQPI